MSVSVDVEYVWDVLPADSVKLPEVIVSLPEVNIKLPEVKVALPAVKVRFLPEATVVSPFKDTVPVPVEKVPVEAD